MATAIKTTVSMSTAVENDTIIASAQGADDRKEPDEGGFPTATIILEPITVPGATMTEAVTKTITPTPSEPKFTLIATKTCASIQARR